MKSSKIPTSIKWCAVIRKNIWWIVLFLALCVLCYLFPYVHDDWAWGSQIGMDRLNTGFSDYGGRYFGYAIVMFMTRFRILRAVFMAGVLMGIGVCVKKLIRHGWALFATVTLMLLASRDIFAQSISWISGFANYATTALIVMIFLVMAVDIVVNKKKETPLLWAIMPFLGFGGCLIMENVTVYLVAMSILLQIYLWVRERRFSVGLLLFSFGTIAGALWMFSNSAYHNIVNSQDEYRTVAPSLKGKIVQARDNYITYIYPYGLLKNVILNVMFSIVGVLILAIDKTKRTKVANISLAIFSLYTIYTVLSEIIIGTTNRPDFVVYGEAIASIVALIALLVFSISMTTKKTELRKRQIILWVTFFILVSPLFLVTPIGPRNFFSSYIVLIAINLSEWQLLFDVMKKKNEKVLNVAKNYLEKVNYIVSFSVVAILIGIFAIVYRADINRVQKVENDLEAGQKTIVIHHLPYESMMWCSTPGDQEFNRRYKLFYGIPDNVEVVVEDYSSS